MRIIGIIAEYNPLHYGHEYQLKLAKETFNADAVVVVMSGNFTQRGTPAILDKNIRAELAIKAGADLVVELPSYYSSGILDDFALGAVSILDKLGCVDCILFGSELGKIDSLTGIARAMYDDTYTYQVIREGMRNKLTIDAANKTLLRRYANSHEQYLEMIDAINKPNNMLGIFYIIALLRLNSDIIPITNMRKGQNFEDDSIHMSKSKEKNYVSATAIRKYVNSGAFLKEEVDWFLKSSPDYTRIELEKANRDNRIIPCDAMWKLFMRKIRSQGFSSLNGIVDITDDCKDRIREGLLSSNTYDDFISVAAKGLRSSAKIDRCIVHYVLNHSADALDGFKNDKVTYYIRVLACNNVGREIFGEQTLPIPSDYMASLQYQNDQLADNVYITLFQNV